MEWQSYIKGFQSYLKLERSLSSNSVEAYHTDVEKLNQFLLIKNLNVNPERITADHLHDFIAWINELGLSARSQARIISGLRAFYKYLLLENLITDDPTQLLDLPRTGRKLPEFLSIDEIERLIAAIDLSKPEG